MSVLRLKLGAVVELLDGKGKILRGVIGKIKDNRVTVALIKSEENPADVDRRRLNTEITLAVSVI